MVLVDFLASSTGRWVRIAAGVVLVAVGLLAVGGTAGAIVAVIGLVPLLAGMFDVCLIAPLFGAPLSGQRIRARHEQESDPIETT
jgi:hypothetical protein